MAKLNVEIPNEVVKVDGIEYRKVGRQARAGDIVKALEEGTDITEGGFYAVTGADDDKVKFNDNVGYPRSRSHANIEVYEKVTVAGPKRLTVGDYAKVTSIRNYGHNYDMASVVKIVTDENDSHPYKAEKADGSVGNWLYESELEPATEAEFLAQRQPKPTPSSQSSDTITHGGRQYRKVARKANVGDLVIVTCNNGHSRFALGSIFTVKNEQGTGDHGVKYGVGQTYIAWESDISVLVPVASASPTFVAKPKPSRLQVGEYAKVTDTDDTCMRDYRKPGDILKITRDDGSPVPFNTEHLDGRYASWARESNLVRATDEEVATAKLAVKVGGFKDGDYAEIIVDRNDDISPSAFGNVGCIVKVKVEPAGNYRGLRLTTTDGVWLGFANAAALRKVDAPVTKREERIPIGSHVRILTDSEDLAKGAIAKVTRDDNDHRPYRCELLDGSDGDWYRPEHLEVISEEEVVTGHLKWAAIGRKPNEYKAGDIVRVTNTCSSGLQLGGIYEVDRKYGGEGDTGAFVKDGEDVWAVECEIVTPVEQRFDNVSRK